MAVLLLNNILKKMLFFLLIVLTDIYAKWNICQRPSSLQKLQIDL